MVSLFDPIKLGDIELLNRIIMAPMTRARASEGRMPNDLMRMYYCQRASAGLIVAEATSVSPQGVGYAHTPGIWSRAQVDAWRTITEAVHAKGGRIVLQLWHVGRVSDPEFLNGQIPVAPSAIACEGMVSHLSPERPFVVPRALRSEEIADIVDDFSVAAQNALSAGFDGVEIHGANGYLIDQFLHDGSNTRTDAYGGSIENRARFLLEIVDACVAIWGGGRVGVHLSPRGGLHGMKDSDPARLFSYVACELDRRDIAFLFLRESPASDSLLPMIKCQFGGAIIANEHFDFPTAQTTLSKGMADAVSFGKAFLSNPDLPLRLQLRAPLNGWDPGSFYTQGPKGYTDYPFLKSSPEWDQPVDEDLQTH